jgi:hypothetical protein
VFARPAIGGSGRSSAAYRFATGARTTSIDPPTDYAPLEQDAARTMSTRTGQNPPPEPATPELLRPVPRKPALVRRAVPGRTGRTRPGSCSGGHTFETVLFEGGIVDPIVASARIVPRRARHRNGSTASPPQTRSGASRQTHTFRERVWGHLGAETS